MTINNPTKLQIAFPKYWVCLHEIGYELALNDHPGWDRYAKKVLSKIKKITKNMNDVEKEEFRKRVTGK